jgi:hypothetical protein
VRCAQDAADDVNFVGKKIGLSLSKFGNTLKDGFTVHQRSTTAGALAHNTAAAAGEADDDSELPPEPDGLRDLITARARVPAACVVPLAADVRSRAADGAACLCAQVFVTSNAYWIRLADTLRQYAEVRRTHRGCLNA